MPVITPLLPPNNPIGAGSLSAPTTKKAGLVHNLRINEDRPGGIIDFGNGTIHSRWYFLLLEKRPPTWALELPLSSLPSFGSLHTT